MPVEKRDLYLQRIAAVLRHRGGRNFSDDDVADVCGFACAGPPDVSAA
jgi:hypothetical protein